MHIPVLLKRVLEFIPKKSNLTILDATFGGGGYTRSFLSLKDTRVIAFDQDPFAITIATQLAQENPGRLQVVKSKFSQMHLYLKEPVDVIVMDIGVSSFQIDDPNRGFSYRKQGPLDMRMGSTGIQDTNVSRILTAETIVNHFSEQELSSILRNGDERHYKKIARGIIEAREKQHISTTSQLSEIVCQSLGRTEKWMYENKHPAMKTFQALRIYINDELGELERGLKVGWECLKPGGIFMVVTFHSLEDKMVKRFFKPFQLSKVIVPDEQEMMENPRSSSAKLRVAQKPPESED